MLCLRWSGPGSPGRSNLNAVILVFALHFIIMLPALTLKLSDLDPWDQSLNIYQGKQLTQGELPVFSSSPLVTLLHAVAYLPVRDSVAWMSSSVSIARCILFSLLWWSAFLLALRMKDFSPPPVIIGFLVFSPALQHLLTNSAHALFAAMAGFALWQFLHFLESKRVKHLWLTSLFLGLAALCRTEAFIILGVFFIFSVGWSFRRGCLRAGTVASVVPFVALVGGYLLLYGALTGSYTAGIAPRSYFTFIQGHSFAYSDRYPDKNMYAEGMPEAERLFGTAAENHNSVLRAILKNPVAYLQRIPRLAMLVIRHLAGVYGSGVGVLLLLLVFRGALELVEKKAFTLLATLLLWGSFMLLYILLCFQRSHLLIPYTVVFALASAGVSATLAHIHQRKEIILWSGALAGAIVYAYLKGPPLFQLLPTLALLAWLWIMVALVRQSGHRGAIRANGYLLLLAVALWVRGEAPLTLSSNRAPGADEEIVSFMRNNLPRDAEVAGWAPGRIWAANMHWVSMLGTLYEIKSSRDLAVWLEERNVVAIYADNGFRANEALVYGYLKELTGGNLKLAIAKGNMEVFLVKPSREKVFPDKSVSPLGDRSNEKTPNK